MDIEEQPQCPCEKLHLTLTHGAYHFLSFRAAQEAGPCTTQLSLRYQLQVYSWQAAIHKKTEARVNPTRRWALSSYGATDCLHIPLLFYQKYLQPSLAWTTCRKNNWCQLTGADNQYRPCCCCSVAGCV